MENMNIVVEVQGEMFKSRLDEQFFMFKVTSS